MNVQDLKNELKTLQSELEVETDSNRILSIQKEINEVKEDIRSESEDFEDFEVVPDLDIPVFSFFDEDEDDYIDDGDEWDTE